MSIFSLAYEGHPITIRDDGWFNATEAAAKFGKRLDKWLGTQETKEYISTLCEMTNTPEKGYLQTRRGVGGGTWLHPKLAIMFARWLDPRFGVWCDMQIAEIMRQEAEGSAGEYLPSYHALHQRVDDLAAESQNKKFVHINLNKLINGAIGIGSGERHGLPVPRKSLLIVAQATATHAMAAANDHHDGYRMAKQAMQTIKPIAQQLAGQSGLQLG